MNLTPPMKKLILHWGEMGSRWGLNRSVAQIYALLYFSPGTLTADERRRRELDPTREVLRETLAELDEGTEGEAYVRERVSDMLEFFSAATAWHEESQRLSPRALRKLANLAGKIRGLVKDTGGRS